MTTYWRLAGISAIAALALTPLVTRASLALGLVDAPGGRKVHRASVPRLGGVAVVAAACLALAGVTMMDQDARAALPSVTPIIAAALLVFLIGPGGRGTAARAPGRTREAVLQRQLRR